MDTGTLLKPLLRTLTFIPIVFSPFFFANAALGCLSVCEHSEREGALVLHLQLLHDRALLDGHDRHDPAARAAQGDRAVQRSVHPGGGQGGERLEARARGRVPPAGHQSHALQRVRGHWSAALLHVLCYPVLCPAGSALPSQPRIPDNCLHLALRLHGLICR